MRRSTARLHLLLALTCLAGVGLDAAARNNKPPTCFGLEATIADRRGAIAPTAGDDVIVGDDERNVVEADVVPGQVGGADHVCAGDGNDRLDFRQPFEVVAGPLRARGGTGNDTLLGTDGDDELFGGAGKDFLGGFRGANRLVGGGGDAVLPSSGPDRLEGGAGNDDLRADDAETEPVGIDILDGGPGDDTLRADDGRGDTVDCGPGRDTAFVDPGLDFVSGCERLNPAEANE